MGSSLGFGSSACDYGSCDPRPIQTRFRFGSDRQVLTSPHTANSPDHSSIGTPSPYCLRSNRLRLLVGTRFQVLFHSPPGVLFTFPSRYWFTIGGREYLAFGGGPPEFTQGFSCPGLLGKSLRSRHPFIYRAVTVSGPAFQQVRLAWQLVTSLPRYRETQRSHDPAAATPVGLTRPQFRLTPVRSPLLGGSLLLSFPRGTKMFQFPRLPPALSG